MATRLRRDGEEVKVLHVGPISGDRWSGLNHSIPALVNAQRQCGADAVLLNSCAVREEVSLANVVALPKCKTRRDLAGLVTWADLIILHSTYIPFHLRVAFGATSQCKPYVIVPRGGMTYGARQTKYLKKSLGDAIFFDYIVRHAAEIHYLSAGEASASEIVGWERPWFVVGNGIDVPVTNSRLPGRESADLRFVFIGRLSIHQKGLDLLLQGVHHYNREFGSLAGGIFIYGHSDDGSRRWLLKKITDFGLETQVFIGEAVFDELKSEILRSADIFIHTSRFEGQPMAVLEALALGLPCLVTPGTNMANAIEALGAGWKVDATPDSIAEGLRRVVSEVVTLSDRRKAARSLASHYSWENVASETLQHYERICKNRFE